MLLIERSQCHEVHAVRFHLYDILRNTTVGKKNRSVVFKGEA